MPSLVTLWRRRELLAALVARDLHTRYKGSVLGVLWSLGHPLVLVAVYTIAFRYFLRIAIPNYALFLLTGLLPWLFVATSLGMAVGSIVDQGALVKKVSFPREALPLAVVGAQFVHFAVAYLIVVPALAGTQIGVGRSLVLLPLLMVFLAIFTGGLALLVALSQVYLRDSRHLLEVAIQIWFWLTPIVYSLRLNVPERLRPLFYLNPMAGFVDAFRAVILEGRAPDPLPLAALCVAALVVFAIGHAVFLKGQARIAEYV